VKTSTERILTTHVGSLARPHALIDLVQAKIAGQPYDTAELEQQTKSAVEDVVRQQAECGIDVVSDGEQSKASFLAYISDRLGGLERDTVGAPDRGEQQHRRGMHRIDLPADREYPGPGRDSGQRGLR